MATPNYSYEKRQRELAKKRKAEEKRQKKAQRHDQQGGAPDGEPAQPENGTNEGETPAPSN